MNIAIWTSVVHGEAPVKGISVGLLAMRKTGIEELGAEAKVGNRVKVLAS
jgi:hypothetical protein